MLVCLTCLCVCLIVCLFVVVVRLFGSYRTSLGLFIWVFLFARLFVGLFVGLLGCVFVGRWSVFVMNRVCICIVFVRSLFVCLIWCLCVYVRDARVFVVTYVCLF